MRLCLLSLLLLSSVWLSAQDLQPLVIARGIFESGTLAKKKAYYTGEYKGVPSKKEIHPLLNMRFKLLRQDSATAVVNMTLTDSLGRGIDTYLHFEKASTWKMCAFRGLAMTGLLHAMLGELEAMTPRQVDSIVAAAKPNPVSDEMMISSHADYNFLLGNTRLTLALDDSLVAHFLRHKAAFEKIRDVARARKTPSPEDADRSLFDDLKPACRKLFVSSVLYAGWELNHQLEFLIGGILDNSVGYLYVADPKELPSMHPDNIILLRPMGDGWYLYKTT